MNEGVSLHYCYYYCYTILYYDYLVRTMLVMLLIMSSDWMSEKIGFTRFGMGKIYFVWCTASNRCILCIHDLFEISLFPHCVASMTKMAFFWHATENCSWSFDCNLFAININHISCKSKCFESLPFVHFFRRVSWKYASKHTMTSQSSKWLPQ